MNFVTDFLLVFDQYENHKCFFFSIGRIELEESERHDKIVDLQSTTFAAITYSQALLIIPGVGIT